MHCFILALWAVGAFGPINHQDVISPYVVKQAKTVYWAVAPTMDSASLATLSVTLAGYGIGFKPVVERNAAGQITRLYGNIVPFDSKRPKPTDTLLAKQVAFPEDQRNWPMIKSINAGSTPIPLVLLPLGFRYDPVLGVHSGAIDENFPQSLRTVIDKLCPDALADKLFEENKARLRQFKASLTKGKPAFPFGLPNVNGKRIQLSDYKGKVVLLDFWAHWCQPCIGEMEYIKQVIPQLGTQPDLVVLYVSVDEPKDRDRWLQALQKHAFIGTHVLADGGWKGPVARAYGITGIPATYLIDRNGDFYAVELPWPSVGGGKPLIELLEKVLSEPSTR